MQFVLLLSHDEQLVVVALNQTEKLDSRIYKVVNRAFKLYKQSLLSR